MTYPASAPFVYTAIPDFVFDQVMTFTTMNALKDNIDNVASALEVEHNFDGGQGRHRRIFLKGNSVINPSARQGNLFWWDGGVATNYDNPGVDTDQALLYNPANFNPEDWTSALGQGPQWTIVPAVPGVLVADLSEAIPITAAKNINLNAQMSVVGWLVGTMGIDVVCYDNAGIFLGIIAQSVIGSTEADSIFEDGDTTPANTAYVRIRKWIDAAASATLFTVKKIQLNDTTSARSYNDDSHVNSYVSIHYESDAGQTFSPGTTIVNFEDKVYDDPNTDRVTVGANWKFTAERFMRLRISAHITFLQASIWGNSSIRLELWRTPSGGAAVYYKNVDKFEAQVNPLTNYSPNIAGSAQITLNKGDAWDLRLTLSGGIPPNQALSALGRLVWVDAEEI